MKRVPEAAEYRLRMLPAQDQITGFICVATVAMIISFVFAMYGCRLYTQQSIRERASRKRLSRASRCASDRALDGSDWHEPPQRIVIPIHLIKRHGVIRNANQYETT